MNNGVGSYAIYTQYAVRGQDDVLEARRVFSKSLLTRLLWGKTCLIFVFFFAGA
jgi:hypothetical protein